MVGLYDPVEHGAEEIISLLLPLLESFLPESALPFLSISRVDYTIDAFLPSDAHVLLMIKLAKKTGMSRGFQETYPARIRNAEGFNDNYSYNISRTGKEYCINLYAKHKQLSADRKNIPADLLEQTEGMLRAEISCFLTKSAIPIWQEELLNELFGPKTLLSTYKEIMPKIFPHGTHIKSTAAKEMIKNQYKNQRTLKKHLLNFLDIIITYHSFHGAYSRLHNKNILKKELLDALYSIDVNPVTIAVNEKIHSLPSIYTVLGLHG